MVPVDLGRLYIEIFLNNDLAVVDWYPFPYPIKVFVGIQLYIHFSSLPTLKAYHRRLEECLNRPGQFLYC